MHIRHKRTLAVIAVLSATTPALIALSTSPASAGTTGGLITCTPPPGAPAGTPDAPFGVSFTATAPASALPSGAAYSVTGDLTITVPGAVAAGFHDQLAGTSGVSFTGGKVALSATNTTGSLVSPLLPGKPTVAITGYNATGGPGGTATADDINFTFTGVTFSGATTAGANGQTVNVSLASNQAASGLAFALQPSGVSLGFGAPGMGGSIQSPTGTCAGVGAPYPSLGSTALVDPTPVVGVSGTYGAVAGISNALSVTASDAGGAGIVPASWAITSGPNCTGAGGNGTASISGTATGATVTFTAPNNTATCTIGVKVGDGVSTSSEAVLNVNVAAGDSLQQNVTQVVNPGVLDLLACGSSTPDPATCSITMSPITLNGSDQFTNGTINPVTVRDARGVPVGWSLSAQLAGPLVNSSQSGPNAQIAANLLKITPSCAPAAGNSNTAPTAGGAGQSLATPAALCSATGGQNTGSFTATAGLDLTVPSTVYSGTYQGTINFIVS